MRKTLLLVVSFALAVSTFASPSLFTKYEKVRQALLTDSVANVKTASTALAAEARKAKQTAVATKADAVAKSTDLNAAREAFGSLSTEMIKFRATATGAKPAVYTCPMAKKDWLQAKGKVSNPYEPGMRECGLLKSE